MATILNLFAGPGAGKSTICAEVFGLLKRQDVECEMALEWAKELVWEGSLKPLENQLYVFANQLQRIHRLETQVDVIITDSPLLFSLMYGEHYGTAVPAFRSLVLEEHRRRNNLNFFIQRKKQYHPKGRLQTEEEAIALDLTIKRILETHKVPYTAIPGDEQAASRIVSTVINYLKPSEERENSSSVRAKG